MRRVPEPELMLEDEQARAYAEADFSEPHNNFVQSFREKFGPRLKGHVLDLGCGAADIAIRFAEAYPQCIVHGIDGSEAMLKYGREAIRHRGLKDRIRLYKRYLPARALPQKKYDAIISNSLLHHLDDPAVLWKSIEQFARPGAPVFVMDLMRPVNRAEARKLTRLYAASEPSILRRDFYNSLLAAYTIAEVQAQLEQAGLRKFWIRQVSDRHFQTGGLF